MTEPVSILGSPSRRGYVLRRLHSLTGVAPLGFFLVEHLYTNAHALEGQRSFIEAVAQIQKIPFLPLVETAGIFLPLLFHSLYGILLAFRGKPNALQYSYAKNWMYVLQRVTGVIAFVFIAVHLYEFRLQKAIAGMAHESFYDVLSAHLSWTMWGVPWIAFFYLIGIASVVFHFANGLVGFSMSWGIAITRKAQQRVAWLAAALGIGLFVLGAAIVTAFATGTTFGFPQT